ncbi:MAG: VOC family protein [Anaerolineae bacterium]|nr:VOC family protein [Anaerolineae bacterium]
MSRITHFELPAKDPEKLAAFYREVFGWEITKWEGPVEYWLVKTGAEGTPGIDGGFFKPEDGMPAMTVNTIDVADLDASIAKLTANGGAVPMPKLEVPGIGWMAYCKDVEGTLFGLMQMDETVGLDQPGE